MYTLTTASAATLAFLARHAYAQGLTTTGTQVAVVGDQTITGSLNATPCPNAVNVAINGKDYCCPGAVSGRDDDAYCCVGAPPVSFAACFPFCSTTTTMAAPSCKSTVKFNDGDYSSKIAAATSGMTMSGTTGVNVVMTSASGSESRTSSGSAAAGSATSSNSQGGAAAMGTSGPMAGALMVAGGFLLGL